MKLLNRLIVLGTIALFSSGCGGSSNPPTYPVTGKVTLDGKAIEGAAVTFVAEKPENSAATKTKADGTYELATFNAGDGAMPGSYKVMVTKYNQPEEENPYGAPNAAPVDQDPAAISEAYSKGYGGPPKKGAKQAKPDNEIPLKYASVATSGLTFTVETKPNTFDIPLKSK